MLPNKIDSKLYRHRNINIRNTNYQKQNIDIFRVYRNISFPTRYISHEKHKYAPICIPRDVQLAMRIFINRTPLPPLPVATARTKRNTRRVGIPLNLSSDIFPLSLSFMYSIFRTLASSCSYMHANTVYVAYFLPRIFARA